MAKKKGTDIVGIRDMIHGRGDQSEKDFLASLSPELAELHKNALSITWLPLDQETLLYEKAAHFLYAGAANPMRELGAVLARKNYDGIYRFFMRIPKLEFIARQAAHMWQTYFDTGDGVVENFKNHDYDFVVRNFPDLPESMREAIAGNLYVISDLAGTKNIRIRLVNDDPRAWRWQVRGD